MSRMTSDLDGFFFFVLGQVASSCESIVKLSVAQEVRNFVTTSSEILASPEGLDCVEVVMN
jgi:hypothetical protein